MIVPKERMDLFSEMEAMYEKRNADYFIPLLTHEDYVIRTRATCILVDFGGEDKVSHIAKVLKDDPNELVRHEAAFSLGQMCHPSGIARLGHLLGPLLYVRLYPLLQNQLVCTWRAFELHNPRVLRVV